MTVRLVHQRLFARDPDVERNDRECVEYRSTDPAQCNDSRLEGIAAVKESRDGR